MTAMAFSTLPHKLRLHSCFSIAMATVASPLFFLLIFTISTAFSIATRHRKVSWFCMGKKLQLSALNTLSIYPPHMMKKRGKQ